MSILSFIIGIAILILVLKILTFPIRLIFRFVVNSIVGGIVLGICAFFGIIVTVNVGIILLTGLFGVPGLVIGLIITALV